MAAGTTYEPIATSTVSTPVATITFSSISQAYTDLKVVMLLADDSSEAGTGAPTFTFNNDTATNYSQTVMYGNGTTTIPALQINVAKIYALYWNNSPTSTTQFPLMILDVMGYTGSTYKTTLISAADDRNGTGSSERSVGLWRSTSAINRIDVTNDGAKKFATGSIITIYGIKAA